MCACMSVIEQHFDVESAHTVCASVFLHSQCLVLLHQN